MGNGMVSLEQRDILKELETFLQELEYYRFSRSIRSTQPLSRRQVVNTANLRNKLLRSVGRYKFLIIELIRKEDIQILEKASLYSSDNWLRSLEAEFDFTAYQVLGYCIDITQVAIGRLEDDISRGYRDRQGNLIEEPHRIETEPPKAFISHGKESRALTKVAEFLRTIGIEPIIVEERPTLDKALPDKVDFYLNLSDLVVIVATGDDKIEGKLYPRQNVIHEIGLAQKTHAGKIIYLLEEKTEFPSNIRTKVWETFSQDNMENVFQYIVLELKEFGIAKTIKP